MVIDDSGRDEREVWMSIEQLRIEGKIDGYIVPRALYSMLNIRSRRHTLGLQREQPKGLRERFIPPPMHGFTLLVGRVASLLIRSNPCVSSLRWLHTMSNVCS